MREPVFSGPSGRRGKIRRNGRALKNGGDEVPRPGDYVEFADAPGETFELLDVRGDQGRINVRGKDRWITISSEKRTLLPETGGLLPSWNDSIAGMFENTDVTKRRTGEFATREFPLTYDAGYKAATENNIPAIVGLIDVEKKKVRADAEKLRRELARRIKHVSVQPPTDEEYKQDVAEVSRRIKEGIRLEKPQGSSLHHFRHYLEGSNASGLTDEMKKFLEYDFQSMVIEHDWAQAFTTDDEGEVPLPFDYVCFEFRVSGLRLLVMMGQGTDGIVGVMCTGVNGRWYVNADTFTFINGKFASRTSGVLDPLGDDKIVVNFLQLVGRQIRAVCIMLDAGVADAEREEPSIAINKKRAMNGKTLLKPYHVVRLGKRHRRYERGDSVPTGRHNRLHVRRGHWRHYKDGGSGRDQYTDAEGTLRSKTWINWMLVGQPDLGFVDKEYRL